MRNMNGVRGIIASSSFHVPVEGQALSPFVLWNGGMQLKKSVSDFKDMFNRLWGIAVMSGEHPCMQFSSGDVAVLCLFYTARHLVC